LGAKIGIYFEISKKWVDKFSAMPDGAGKIPKTSGAFGI
jgi:hypothetical protein